MKHSDPFNVPMITIAVVLAIVYIFCTALGVPATFLAYYPLIVNVVFFVACGCLVRYLGNPRPQKPDGGMECNSVADFVGDSPIKLSMFCLNCIACLYLIAIAVATLGTILGRRPLAILGLVMVAVAWCLERYLNRRAFRKINDEERRWRIK